MLGIVLLLNLLALISPITSLPPPARYSLPPNDHHVPKQQPILASPNKPNQNLTSNFRPALESDLPAITTIIVEAFFPSAAWRYLIPDAEAHKEEIWTCMHEQIVQGWKHFDSDKNFLNVITVPSSGSSSSSSTLDDDDDDDDDDNNNNTQGPSKEVPVSVAVWNMRTPSDDDAAPSSSYPSSSSPPPPFLSPSTLPLLLQTCLTPPGTNLTRALDFDRQNQAVLHKYFYPSEAGSAWPGQAQLYLNLLATHPAWDGNGFGAAQVEWGFGVSRGGGGYAGRGEERGGGGEEGEKGQEAKGSVPVTLLSSPAGWPLYESLGFEGVENATIGMLDGMGELWFEVCKWDG